MGCGESKDAQIAKNPKVDIGQLVANNQADPTVVVINKQATPRQQKAPELEKKQVPDDTAQKEQVKEVKVEAPKQEPVKQEVVKQEVEVKETPTATKTEPIVEVKAAPVIEQKPASQQSEEGDQQSATSRERSSSMQQAQQQTVNNSEPIKEVTEQIIQQPAEQKQEPVVVKEIEKIEVVAEPKPIQKEVNAKPEPEVIQEVIAEPEPIKKEIIAQPEPEVLKDPVVEVKQESIESYQSSEEAQQEIQQPVPEQESKLQPVGVINELEFNKQPSLEETQEVSQAYVTDLLTDEVMTPVQEVHVEAYEPVASKTVQQDIIVNNDLPQQREAVIEEQTAQVQAQIVENIARADSAQLKERVEAVTNNESIKESAGSNQASDQDAALSSEQDLPNSKNASEEQKQVVPTPDSLIVYEEVQSTPEDAAQFEDRQAEVRGEQVSTSSAEPLVAEEYISAAQNEALYDRGEDSQEQPADESDKTIHAHQQVEMIQERDPVELQYDVQIEVNTFQSNPSKHDNGDTSVVLQKETEELKDKIAEQNSLEIDQAIENQNEQQQEQEPVVDRAAAQAEAQIEAQPEIVNQISIEQINSSLNDLGLVQPEFVNNSSSREGDQEIDTDYFLKVINCSIYLAEREQKSYITQALEKRRAAFKKEDWAGYQKVVHEMSNKEQEMREAMLTKVSEALNLTEEQFARTQEAISQGERAEELQLAMQGQLLHLQLSPRQQESEGPIDQLLSQEQTLQIFEIMLKSRIDQQNLLAQATEEDEEQVHQKVYVLNVKSSDQIWFEYGVEFKQFNEAVSHYIQTCPDFEQKMVEKEEEVMDESI